MTAYQFKVRKEWKQDSHLEPFTEEDLNNQEKFYDLCHEDTLYIESSAGNMILLGWYGEFKEAELVGKIIFDNNIDYPIEEVNLETFEGAVNWVKTWIKKIEKIENKKNESKE
jgi:hypothetical protein